MNIRILESADAASRTAARIIARRVKAQPDAVLALPTGKTAAPIYEHLVQQHPDFSRVHTFNLDELAGLPPDDPRSFRAFMDRHLFQWVNIPRSQVHSLDGSARDWEGECARYERAIAAQGGIDLVMLGIGINGHIGFNEPGRNLSARTNRVRLTRTTRQANADLFGGVLARVPREALTMGVGTILSARAVLLVATGRSKARAVRRMLTGRITPALPASFLQLHANARLILDRAAAAGLSI